MQLKVPSVWPKVVLTTFAGFLLVQCSPREATKPAGEDVAAKPALAPITPPALSRADLIAAASLAASNHALGKPEDQSATLVGRVFSIRVPFGCEGPEAEREAAPADGRARWMSDGEAAGRLTLTPADWTDGGPLAGAEPTGDKAWEAAEGFWVTRPWILGDGCPAQPAAAPAPAPEAATPPAKDAVKIAPPPKLVQPVVFPTPETLGLVAFFTADESRFTRRNGRAYAYTLRGDPPPEAGPKGYVAVFGGRVTAFPDGKAIHCRSLGPSQKPVCVLAIKLDRVAFESAADGSALTEWRKG